MVPTRGRAASVRRLLLSLTSQDEPPPFEVIVSIDGADDETRDLVASFAGRLPARSVSRPRGGRGAACNAGARAAEGRVLVCRGDEDDCIAEWVPNRGAGLFVGNSGTTIRFLTAMVALGHGTYRFDGVPRMRERPIVGYHNRS